MNGGRLTEWDGLGMRCFGRLLVFAVLAGFGLWCYQQLRGDLEQLSALSLGAHWRTLVLVVGLSLGNYALRIGRWQQYLTWLGHRCSLGTTTLYYIAGFAFTLSPGKVGELARARYYQAHGVPFATVMAVFIIERLTDLIAMAGLALASLAHSSRFAALVWVAVLGTLSGTIALAIAPWPRVERWLKSVPPLPEALRRFGLGAVKAFASARELLTPGALLFGLLMGVLAWGSEGLGLGVLSELASTSSLTWSAAIGIYALATILGALSFLPGGLGGTEAVMMALLAAHGLSLPDAVLLTLMCRLVTLWLAVLLGWLSVVALKFRIAPALGVDG